MNATGTIDEFARSSVGRAPARRRQLRGTPLKAIYYLLLTAASLVMALPFFWLLSTSLTARGMEFQIPPQWIPDPIVW
ncbi:MAG TPA: carbohydrate ABC transporter permease, partial [Chloroflexota bacterium]|nr:carbohydrate ABC transporter permease [Chloroflexota bacterium]